MNWEKWFLDNDGGVHIIGYGYEYTVTFEEIYQAFKARMVQEMIEARDIKKHSGYQQCAALYLKKYIGVHVETEFDPANISRAVEIGFDGNINEFVKWADEYLEKGCGMEG